MTDSTLAEHGERAPRRSLILAGGGMRVAYQAGAMRALYEAGLRFEHVDGTSGGIMNLAMLLSGLTPEEMCDRWRTLDPRQFSALSQPLEYLHPGELLALGSAESLRSRVFPHLGIDLDRIRAASLEGTFNIGNFSRKTSDVFTHEQVDLDLLVAGLSLPIFLPPVQHNGSTYTDAVWIRDANLMEAVRRGADELWVVWCIGNSPAYHGGAFNQYVHMIELSANGALFWELDQIADINARIAARETVLGHTRPIVLHLIKPHYPLPLDPDYFMGLIDGGTLVDRGYADASLYLAERRPDGLPLDPGVTAMPEPAPGVAFREVMSGAFALGESDPQSGERVGRANGSTLTLYCAIDIHDVARFVAEPSHAGEMVARITFAPLGHNLPAQRAVFNLFIAPADPSRKLMVYEAAFRVGSESYYLAGRKEVRVAAVSDMWEATTTLYTQLHRGVDTTGPIVGAGVLHISPLALAQLSTSLHATSTRSAEDAIAALGTFGTFFLGQLWNTYFGQQHQTWMPGGTGPLLGLRGSLRRAVGSRIGASGSLRFTEQMRGYVGLGEADFARGFRQGQRDLTPLSFRITVDMPDMAAFVADQHHTAQMQGVVLCEALGGHVAVEKGTFNLFEAGPGARTRLMVYRLFFRDAVQNPLTLSGFKLLRADAALPGDLWSDTTTLYARVMRGHVAADEEGAAALVASGILHLSLPDFMKQLTTFRGTGVSAFASFGALWLQELWEVYNPALGGG